MTTREYVINRLLFAAYALTVGKPIGATLRALFAGLQKDRDTAADITHD